MEPPSTSPNPLGTVHKRKRELGHQMCESNRKISIMAHHGEKKVVFRSDVLRRSGQRVKSLCEKGCEKGWVTMVNGVVRSEVPILPHMPILPRFPLQTRTLMQLPGFVWAHHQRTKRVHICFYPFNQPSKLQTYPRSNQRLTRSSDSHKRKPSERQNRAGYDGN